MKARTTWEGKKAFTMKNEAGNEMRMDAPEKSGGDGSAPSPMEALLGSLAGCMGIDMGMVLKRYTDDIKRMEFETVGERNDGPPNYFTAIEITVHLDGDVPASRVWRAVNLSADKYCSVAHSLKADLSFKVILNGEEAPEE